MTPCTHLSDRMPEVALGRGGWTLEEERHLAGCEDCRAEWALVTAGGRVGAALPTLDAARVAAGVLERIRHGRVRARRKASRMAALTGLAAAAMVALAVWANRGGRSAVPAGSGLPAPAPVAASPSESVPEPAPRSSPTPSVARGSVAPTIDLPMPELDSLPAEALDSILTVLDEPLAQVGADDQQPDDSGDRELEQMLAGMEG